MKRQNPKDRNKELSAMQNLCSKSEKCIHDVRVKLISHHLSEEDQNWVIGKLLEDQFIDEERYTSFFVRDKLKINHWGKLKIRQALIAKHIPEDIREKYLEEIDPGEYRRILHEELSKKRRTLKAANPYENRMKLFRYAAQKGFEADLIYDEVGAGDEENEF